MYNKFGIDERLEKIAEEVELEIADICKKIDKVAEENQLKVLASFQKYKISDAHFAGSSGYGYGDIGRDAIEAVFSETFGCEDALVRSQFVSGTHAINVMLWGVLRPNDNLLYITGKPYDTLEKVIGIADEVGSLKEFGVNYLQVDLLQNGDFDLEKIKETLTTKKVKALVIQRSRGYSLRPSMKVEKIGQVIKYIKEIDSNVICMVDNCYGEFVETIEPTNVGADLMVGSLIKNAGGGIAPTGAYIAGKKHLVEMCANRLTSPGVGKECGATLGVNKSILQGFFLAPVVTSQARKGAIFEAAFLKRLGFNVSPDYNEDRSDIIQAIIFGDKDKLIAFCQGIQAASPIDSHVLPQPWDMPGYTSEVIMAAGAFNQGSSIELSADAPIREPYALYLQGGLTYFHVKYAMLKATQNMINKGFYSLE